MAVIYTSGLRIMDEDKIKGYSDQEILFRAIAKFLSTQINRSEQIITGLMKQSLSEWSDKNKMTIKDVKNLDETTRLRVVTEMLDIFTDKIKHLVESKLQRDKLKNSSLQIYEQWKKTRRGGNSEDLLQHVDTLIKK